MAHTAKTTGAAEAVTEMPFEQALEKLESVVEAMEGGELSLETLLARFEEGTRLVRICQAKLEEAEVKIQQLERTVAGEMELKPLLTSGEEDL